MPKPERHGTERKREFTAEKDCQRAVDWLNCGQDDSGRRRIRQLLRNIQVLSSNWVEVIDEDDGEPALSYRGSREQYALAYQAVIRLLRRYTFSPLIFPFASSMFHQWTPISGPGGRFKGRWPPSAGRYDDVEAVFELTTGGGLTKVKECFCGKWFFVKFAHQKFCSAPCRDKANKSLPKWKEYRRKKAREYYWLHKNRNIK
jgi:hypothetical protein